MEMRREVGHPKRWPQLAQRPCDRKRNGRKASVAGEQSKAAWRGASSVCDLSGSGLPDKM
jgi:hypothetical protein